MTRVSRDLQQKQLNRVEERISRARSQRAATIEEEAVQEECATKLKSGGSLLLECFGRRTRKDGDYHLCIVLTGLASSDTSFLLSCKRPEL